MATTTLDRDGPVALGRAIRRLRWPAGSGLTVAANPTASWVKLTLGGPHRTTAQGLLRLPSAIRLACRLLAGDSLLLTSKPTSDLLLAFTPFAVERLWKSLAGAEIDDSTP